MLLLTICIASCKRIELQRATSAVYLRIVTDSEPVLAVPLGFDVHSAPELYERMYGPEIQMYRICLYDTETHQFVGEDFLPPEGGFLSAVSGIYDMIVYNVGSPVTILENEHQRSMAYACTNAERAGDGLLIPEPEHVFAAAMEGVKIPVYAESDSVRTIDITTKRLAETYSLDFSNVRGLEKVAKVQVLVSGQVPGRYLWDNRAEDMIGYVYFTPMIDLDKGRIYALFNTFGRNEYRYNKVEIVLMVTDKNSRQFRWKVDVTDQLDNPDNTNNEIAIDSKIEIPDTDEGDGMIPNVNDWQGEIIPVPIK